MTRTTQKWKGGHETLQKTYLKVLLDDYLGGEDIKEGHHDDWQEPGGVQGDAVCHPEERHDQYTVATFCFLDPTKNKNKSLLSFMFNLQNDIIYLDVWSRKRCIARHYTNIGGDTMMECLPREDGFPEGEARAKTILPREIFRDVIHVFVLLYQTNLNLVKYQWK